VRRLSVPESGRSTQIVSQPALMEGDNSVRRHFAAFLRLLKGRPRAFAGAVALFVLSLCLAAPNHIALLARPNTARRTAKQAAQRLLALCDNLQGPSSIDTFPTYFDDTHISTSDRICRRRVWTGFVLADGQLLSVVMSDATGSLVYVFHAGEAAGAASHHSTPASVCSAALAAKVYLQTVRALEMIPRRAEVALAGRPTMNAKKRIWQVTWRVRDAAAHSQYQVKVGLREQDGRLVYAANRDEASRYVVR
jgi:hypothetical protein